MIQTAARFFQTDLSYLFKGGSWIIASKLVASFASFLLVLAFGNLVSQTTYGTYQYVLSIVGILSVTTLPGMTNALTQATAQGREGVFYEMTALRIRWGLIGGALSLLMGTYYFFQGSKELVTPFLLAAMFIPFMDSLTLWSGTLAGRRDFKHSALCTAVFQLLRLLTILPVLFVTDDIAIIIGVYLTSTTFLRALLTLFLHRFRKPNAEYSGSYIPYGKHLSLMTLLGSISTVADKIILWHFLGPVALATYAFARTPIIQVQSCFKFIEALAFPRFAATEGHVLKRTLPTKLFRSLVVIVPTMILYVILAPWLYSIALPQYTDSVIYSQVLALILLFLPQKLMVATLMAHSQKKALYTLTTITPLAKIFLQLGLIPVFGLWGAIIGTIIPYLIGFIILSYFFRRI